MAVGGFGEGLGKTGAYIRWAWLSGTCPEGLSRMWNGLKFILHLLSGWGSPKKPVTVYHLAIVFILYCLSKNGKEDKGTIFLMCT